jgi:hypothetical protein
MLGLTIIFIVLIIAVYNYKKDNHVKNTIDLSKKVIKGGWRAYG